MNAAEWIAKEFHHCPTCDEGMIEARYYDKKRLWFDGWYCPKCGRLTVGRLIVWGGKSA